MSSLVIRRSQSSTPQSSPSGKDFECLTVSMKFSMSDKFLITSTIRPNSWTSEGWRKQVSPPDSEVYKYCILYHNHNYCYCLFNSYEDFVHVQHLLIGMEQRQQDIVDHLQRRFLNRRPNPEWVRTTPATFAIRELFSIYWSWSTNCRRI